MHARERGTRLQRMLDTFSDRRLSRGGVGGSMPARQPPARHSQRQRSARPRLVRPIPGRRAPARRIGPHEAAPHDVARPVRYGRLP